MKKATILIVESDLNLCEELEEAVQQFNYNLFSKCHSVQEALSVCKYRRPDLALISINLNDKTDGMDLASYFKKEYDFPIIFITNDLAAGYLERAKLIHPAAILFKPFDKNNLLTSISLGLNNYNEDRIGNLIEPSRFTENDEIVQMNDAIFIKEKGRLLRIVSKDIIWIEACDAYSILHTNQKRYLVYSSLKKMEDKLNPAKFVRIHRSSVINISRISEVASDHVILGSCEVSIGKSYRTELFGRLNIL